MQTEIGIGKYDIFADNIRRADSPLYADGKAVLESHKNKKELFEKVYSSNVERITFFSYSYLGDLSEAQNVAHDVFASFWKNMENVQQECFTSYIFESAKNKCLNVLRKRTNFIKYQNFSLKRKCDYLNKIALENFDSPQIYEADVEDLISKGMEMMKPKIRRTFFLSRYKGLKNKEIAAKEGIVESAVEARITAALLIMKKLLKDYI